MAGVAKAVSAACPECNTNIRFEEPPHLGQLVPCPECGETLEVVRRNPLKLDWAYEMSFDERSVEDDEFEDDWEDDWDDDFEDFEEEEDDY